MSDETTVYVGEKENWLPRSEDWIEFSSVNEIIGVYAKVEKDNTGARENHLASIGFITNECSNSRLSQLAQIQYDRDSIDEQFEE